MDLFNKAKKAVTGNTPLNQIPEIKKINNLNELTEGSTLILTQTYEEDSITNNYLELIHVKNVFPNKYEGVDIRGKIYIPIWNPITKKVKLEMQENNLKIIKKDIHLNGCLKKEWFIYKPD